MDEITINLHIHSRYSDGHASHSEIASAAIAAGLDAVIVTDHNLWVNGPERYYTQGDKRVLLLIGEEVHDQARQPAKNHMLVFGASRELATFAYDPQRLIDEARKYQGLTFIAHPVDPAAPVVAQDDLSWVDWQVQGFTGIELWNGFSEFKTRLKSKLHAIYYAYQPERVTRAPLPEAIVKWDELLKKGNRIVAIGGSDAHAIPFTLGPLKRTVFPLSYHFRAVNTHVLLEKPLTGDALEDRRMILDAIRQGRVFVGYDLPAPTRGFRFSAQGNDGVVWMGDDISIAQGGITLQVRLPIQAECRLLKDGKPVKTWMKRTTYAHITTEPGIYRVEAYIIYHGEKRGWIYSNPIYVR